MKDLRNDLDDVSVQIARIKDISELLGDYFFYNCTGREHSKGDTLITVLIEKIQELDKSIENIYKKERKN